LTALKSHLSSFVVLWLPVKHQVYPGVPRFTQGKRAFPDVRQQD
jgi:hypothetical protein